MKEFPKVAIILLNYNGLADTIECLESLEKVTYPNYELNLVDNCSDGNDVEILREKYNHLYDNLIEIKPKNLGFAGGNDFALRKLRNREDIDYFFLLSNDTTVKEDFLEILVQTAERDGKIGIVGPKIFFYEEPSKVWFSGGEIDWFRASFLEKKDNYFRKTPLKVRILQGCCWLVRKEVFNKIGYLDENYYLYFEDADFCTRAKKAGYLIVWEPNSIMYHKINLKPRRTSPTGFYHYYRSKIIFMKKLAPWPYKILFLATFPVYLGIKIVIMG